MIKKIFSIFLIITGLMLGIFYNAQALENRGAFIITNFEVDILVKKDAVLEIREEIDVNFSEKRHGIFREIPIKYKDDKGFEYNMQLEIISIENEKGDSVQYEIISSGADKVLQVGDPDLEIIGDQKYVIRYDIEKGVRYFDDHDEIFWNPIGTGWPTQILQGFSMIRFENGVDFIAGNSVCFTGEFGSKDENCLVEEYENEKVNFKTTKTLKPNEGLTVAVHLPKGEVWEPSDKERIIMFLSDNWGFGLPVFAFVGMYLFWRRRGKEISLNKTVIAHYEAPDNLTPGEMGYLMKERYTNRLVAADIINLAVKGYLEIEETEETTNSLALFIGNFFRFAFITLFAGLFFVYSVTYFGFGENIIFFGFTIFIIMIFLSKIKKTVGTNHKTYEYELENKKDWKDSSDLTEHEKELLEGLFGLNKMGRIKLKDKQDKFYENVGSARSKLIEKIKKEGYFEGGFYNNKVFYIVTASFILAAIVFLSAWMERLDLLIGGLLSVVIVGVFGVFMSKRTQKGAEAYWQIKGYKHYIDVAEKNRIEFNAQRNIFEKTLPYAMVFGNADKWAKAFDGVIEKSPNWYKSKSGDFSPVVFASTVNNGFVTAAQAASVSPQSSSSSGGGGFSGGGGGGGGGGSW